jgi:hypothetical protein
MTLVSHSRDVYITLERGILRYAIPTFFKEEKHFGSTLTIEIDTFRSISGLQKISTQPLVMRACLPAPFKDRDLPLYPGERTIEATVPLLR